MTPNQRNPTIPNAPKNHDRSPNISKPKIKHVGLNGGAIAAMWKPAHLWLLVGMAKRSRLTAVQDGRGARATQGVRRRACLDAKKKLCAPACAHTLREWSARTKSFMLGEVTAPKCFYQAKVFHELNPPKIELLQSVFCVIASSPFMPSPILSSGELCSWGIISSPRESGSTTHCTQFW